MYCQLTKARLSALVVLSTIVGFIVASGGPIAWLTLLWTVVGTALTAASANALNEVIEVQRDRLMKRTQNRPLPSNAMSARHALALAVIVGYVGVMMLAVLVNLAAAGFALLTLLLYVLAYTPLKPRTTLNTLVGAVCGAIPPLIGWVAAGAELTTGAWALALLLFIWQIPHFLALAWLYRHEYERAGFAMLPVIDRSGHLTARVVVATIFALLALGVVMMIAGLAGWIYAIGSIVLGTWMLLLGLRMFRNRTEANARRVFLASLVYLTVLLCLWVIDPGPLTPAGAATAPTKTFVAAEVATLAPR